MFEVKTKTRMPREATMKLPRMRDTGAVIWSIDCTSSAKVCDDREAERSGECSEGVASCDGMVVIGA